VPETSVFSDEELERVLRQTAPFVAYPEIADLSGLVGRRLRETPPPAVRRRWAPWDLRRVLRPIPRPGFQPALARAAVALVVAIAVFAGTMVFSPGARHAVAGWLGLRGVKITVTPSPTTSSPTVTPSPMPTSLGSGLDLGKRVTLAQVQGLVPFEITIPAELGPPDEVYLRTGFVEDQVILLYRSRPGLPAAQLTGAGLLFTEFQARVDTEFVEGKILFLGATSVDPVTVNGDPGYWIEGAPHEIQYFDPDGTSVPDRTRLAGNVLLWQHEDVTFRIEADIGKAEAIRIAESAGTDPGART
jgi:hypothetical protein